MTGNVKGAPTTNNLVSRKDRQVDKKSQQANGPRPPTNRTSTNRTSTKERTSSSFSAREEDVKPMTSTENQPNNTPEAPSPSLLFINTGATPLPSPLLNSALFGAGQSGLRLGGDRPRPVDDFSDDKKEETQLHTAKKFEQESLFRESSSKRMIEHKMANGRDRPLAHNLHGFIQECRANRVSNTSSVLKTAKKEIEKFIGTHLQNKPNELVNFFNLIFLLDASLKEEYDKNPNVLLFRNQFQTLFQEFVFPHLDAKTLKNILLVCMSKGSILQKLGNKNIRLKESQLKSMFNDFRLYLKLKFKDKNGNIVIYDLKEKNINSNVGMAINPLNKLHVYEHNRLVLLGRKFLVYKKIANSFPLNYVGELNKQSLEDLVRGDSSHFTLDKDYKIYFVKGGKHIDIDAEFGKNLALQEQANKFEDINRWLRTINAKLDAPATFQSAQIEDFVRESAPIKETAVLSFLQSVRQDKSSELFRENIYSRSFNSLSGVRLNYQANRNIIAMNAANARGRNLNDEALINAYETSITIDGIEHTQFHCGAVNSKLSAGQYVLQMLIDNCDSTLDKDTIHIMDARLLKNNDPSKESEILKKHRQFINEFIQIFKEKIKLFHQQDNEDLDEIVSFFKAHGIQLSNDIIINKDKIKNLMDKLKDKDIQFHSLNFSANSFIKLGGVDDQTEHSLSELKNIFHSFMRRVMQQDEQFSQKILFSKRLVELSEILENPRKYLAGDNSLIPVLVLTELVSLCGGKISSACKSAKDRVQQLILLHFIMKSIGEYRKSLKENQGVMSLMNFSLKDDKEREIVRHILSQNIPFFVTLYNTSWGGSKNPDTWLKKIIKQAFYDDKDLYNHFINEVNKKFSENAAA